MLRAAVEDEGRDPLRVNLGRRSGAAVVFAKERCA